MTQTTTPKNPDAADIAERCQKYNMPDMARQFTREGITWPELNNAICTEAARRDLASGGHLNIISSGLNYTGNSPSDILVETLVSRLGGKPRGEIIRHADCASLAVRALENSGHAVHNRDGRDAILRRAMTTGDFPALLGNAVGRVLLQSFEESPPQLKMVARLNSLPDFKNRTVIRLPSGMPSLDLVNEHGEFKYGGVNEAVNGWALRTYGRIISLTRQALVNDDLGAFAGMILEFGKSAARREADELASILTGSPVVDSAPLFHADRSSLVTGAGSALGMTSLFEAVKSLRLQKEVGGGYLIQEPKYLVVPAALESAARQLVATITPAATGSVQPYALEIVVEPRLDAVSQTAWYLVAGNQTALEYGYLDGASGPQTFQEEGFATDGLSIKCRLDFGCGWVAPTGWVKSTGA